MREKVVVTGASNGIGKEVVKMFLKRGHEVYGIDLEPSSVQDPSYHHFIADVSDYSDLPDIEHTNILINNAGTWDLDKDNIAINLNGAIYCTEKYGLQWAIKSIVNVASASAHSGAEFPKYVASKGGLVAYTKWTALEVAKYGATCNSISPGGVTTKSNDHILNDPDLTEQVMQETMLNKWASETEIASWIYFVSMVNKSMTAQDILIDNGEMAKAKFVW